MGGVMWSGAFGGNVDIIDGSRMDGNAAIYEIAGIYADGDVFVGMPPADYSKLMRTGVEFQVWLLSACVRLVAMSVPSAEDTRTCG